MKFIKADNNTATIEISVDDAIAITNAIPNYVDGRNDKIIDFFSYLSEKFQSQEDQTDMSIEGQNAMLKKAFPKLNMKIGKKFKKVIYTPAHMPYKKVEYMGVTIKWFSGDIKNGCIQFTLKSAVAYAIDYKMGSKKVEKVGAGRIDIRDLKNLKFVV